MPDQSDDNGSKHEDSSPNETGFRLSAFGFLANPDFKLLKYQSRTGAVGTYWTTLIGGELAHSDTGALASEGFDLANEFPDVPLSAKDRNSACEAIFVGEIVVSRR